MRVLALIILACTVTTACNANTGSAPKTFELDYANMLILDAESLAEGGIKEGYESVLPQLSRLVSQPAAIEEIVDDKAPSYEIRAQGIAYRIHAPDLDNREFQSWARATHALFKIVNGQLEEAQADRRFYAINAGNDLGGIFLTASEWEAAKASLTRKTDWPYMPTSEPPAYGQYRD
jgi:hypothetical protein